jgi:hypothetical protein
MDMTLNISIHFPTADAIIPSKHMGASIEAYEKHKWKTTYVHITPAQIGQKMPLCSKLIILLPSAGICSTCSGVTNTSSKKARVTSDGAVKISRAIAWWKLQVLGGSEDNTPTNI